MDTLKRNTTNYENTETQHQNNRNTDTTNYRNTETQHGHTETQHHEL
jgi:hypothetical protein